MRRCAWLLCAAACSPTGLPDDLSEPTAWLFGHFDEQDDDIAAQASALAAFASNMTPDAPVAERTYTPDRLQEDHTDDVQAPPLPSRARTVALTSRSEFELRDHRRLLSTTPLGCLHGSSIVSWTREFEDGGSCFGDGLCRDALVRDTVELDDATIEARRQFRQVTLDDGRDALVSRGWLDDDNAAWFTLDVWVNDLEDRRHTWQIQADWLDLRDVAWAVDRQEAHRLATELALQTDTSCTQ